MRKRRNDMSKSKKPAAKHQLPDLDQLSSSPGDDPLVVTPKDVEPYFATARDVRVLPVTSPDPEVREEALLDEAIEETFPASDPIAVPSYDATQEKRKLDREQAARSKSKDCESKG
jgi:hypothetical protein